MQASIRELRRVEYADDPAASLPMVAIAQFYARDIPELPFPEGTDVCQVLWCPVDHEPHYAPRPQVWWRDSSTVKELATALEPHEDSEPGCLPKPCRIAPERVVEFPDSDELDSEELRDRIAEWEQDQTWKYGPHLSAAPGTKVGGWGYWIQDIFQPECAQGHRMDLLLTVASAEHGDVGAWMAQETAAELDFQKEVRFTLTNGSTGNTWIGKDEEFDAAGFSLFGHGVQPGSVIISDKLVPAHNSAPRGMDLMIGDVGSVYLFVCPTCPDRPTAVEFQCC
ncbi:hypothetical protein [Allokutzneria sp. NRRL B-24872]|uniref:hypothetical protein n=1 Tax=Allokutzneria sp. NRRL B-24872 TaxID=1137961 RepID=UPI000A3C9747|nr:hypothetical protein [Allokutzneria sp. NRRL B-24872]